MEQLQNKKILLLGGAGFIGSRLTALLIENYGIYPTIATRTLSKCAMLARYPLRFEPLNLTEDKERLKTLVQEHEIVIDLTYAARGDKSTWVKQAEKMAENLIEACHAAQSEKEVRLVHVSSVSAYGPVTVDELTENTAYNKSGDAYSNSKLTVEKMLMKSGLQNYLVLQPTIVYGPYSGWSYKAIANQQTHKVVLPEEPLMARCCPVYVDDVCQAIIKAAVAGDTACRQKYLISSGEDNVSWTDFYAKHASLQKSLTEPSIKYVSTEALKNNIKNMAKQSKPYRRLLTRIKSDAGIRNELAGTFGFKFAVDFLRSHYQGKQWQNIKDKIGIIEAQSQTTEKMPLYPTEVETMLYTSNFKVNISKAKNQLGYEPEFDFEKGISQTMRWADWFGL